MVSTTERIIGFTRSDYVPHATGAAKDHRKGVIPVVPGTEFLPARKLAILKEEQIPRLQRPVIDQNLIDFPVKVFATARKLLFVHGVTARKLLFVHGVRFASLLGIGGGSIFGMRRRQSA